MPSLWPAQFLLAHAVLQVLRPQVQSSCSLLRTVCMLGMHLLLPAKSHPPCSDPRVLNQPAPAFCQPSFLTLAQHETSALPEKQARPG